MGNLINLHSNLSINIYQLHKAEFILYCPIPIPLGYYLAVPREIIAVC